MDRPDTGTEKPARTLRNPRIGFIGKAAITEEEEIALFYIGRCIARLGHVVVITDAKGATTALKEGVEVEEGSLDIVQKDIIEKSNHTLIYPTPHLLERLRERYPDIENRKDVAIIYSDELNDWVSAVVTILASKNIPTPD